MGIHLKYYRTDINIKLLKYEETVISYNRILYGSIWL